MTENLSIWALIAGASLPVQFVMLLLFAASVISWAMIVQRGMYLRSADSNFHEFEDIFWSGVDLNQLFGEINA
ncbi:MAG: protein TolQ, partial [Porticoccaceae bacterium]